MIPGQQFYRIAILLCVSFAGLSEASAQDPAIIVSQGLDFGSNVTGTTTISYSSQSAGAFAIAFPTYSQQGNVTISFLLPAQLVDAAGDAISISFTNSAAYNVGVNSVNGATQFDPNNGLSGPLGQTAHSDYFWIGGTLTPGRNYTASTYTGTITVSVAVTIGTSHYSATQTIPITATVTGNVSISVSGSLDFGLIVAGTTPPAISAQSASAASITASVSRAGGGTITVTYPATTNLTDMYGDVLTFTPSLYGTNASGDQGGATLVTSNSTVTLSGTKHWQTGYYYMWLGGSLNTVIPGQVPGRYTGNFVITVAY